MNDLSSKFQSLKAQITSFRQSISQESEKIENLYGGYELATKEAQLRAKIREYYYVRWKNALFMKLIKQKHSTDKSFSPRNIRQEYHTRDINITDQNSYRPSSIQNSNSYEHSKRSRIPPKLISKKNSPVIDEPPTIRVKRPERSITLTSSDDEESELVIKARQLLLNTNNAIEAMNAKKNPPPRNTFAERLEKIKLKPLSPKNSPEKQQITQIHPPRDIEEFTKQERSNSDDENLHVSPYASDEEIIDISPYASESETEQEVIQISPYNSESEEEEIKIQISPYQSETEESDPIDKIHDSELLGSSHTEIKTKIEKEFDEFGISSNLASNEKPEDVSSYKSIYNVSNVESVQADDYQNPEIKENEPQISEINNEDNEEEEELPESLHSYHGQLTINDVISVDDYDVPKEGGELPPDLSSIQSVNHEVFNNENDEHYNMDSINDAESDGTMTAVINNMNQANDVENDKIEEDEEEIEEEEFYDDDIKLTDEQDIEEYNDLNHSIEIADEILKNPVDIPKQTPPKETKPSPVQSQQNEPIQQQNNSPKSVVKPNQSNQEDDDDIFILKPTSTREIHNDDEKTEEKEKNSPNDIESIPIINETDLDDQGNQDTDIPIISLD